MDKKTFILIDEANLIELVDNIAHQVFERLNAQPERWIDTEKAMKKLGISSPSTLQKYRDEGKIRFSQPSKKVILYDQFSIDEFLEKNARNTF